MNIVTLAQYIRDAMIDHLRKNPEERSQAAVVRTGVKAGMEFTQGDIIPELIWLLAENETEIYAFHIMGKEGIVKV